MWKLKYPTIKDLQDYEDMMLDDLYNRASLCRVPAIKNALIPTIGDRSVLKTLLTGKVWTTYTLSEKLMGRIFAGYTRDELNQYFKAIHTKAEYRRDEQDRLITKYQAWMNEILKVMGYKQAYDDVKMAYKVTEMKGANVCTYCNRGYIFTISTGTRIKDKIARPELDHWYPKSKYPLLSMNYFNLIPSCTVCNSSVKGSTEFHWKTHVHPYLQRDFNPHFEFHYNPVARKGEQVTIDDSYASEKEKNSIGAFKLKEVYNCHADLEARELYDLALRHGDHYLRDLLGLIHMGFPDKTEQDIYRMVFGAEMNPLHFGNRPMSKFKHDLLKQMMVIRHGHWEK